VALATQQVATLPTPKPKKTIPHKATRFVILHHAGRIWLQQRPPTGIWGGLWSFPELDMATDVLTTCRDEWQLQIAANHELPAFKHVFTHFSLMISPHWVDVVSLPLTIQESAGRWLSVADAMQAAIPAPVRIVLTQIS
jgi:A/G-specific adenine glycosylase